MKKPYLIIIYLIVTAAIPIYARNFIVNAVPALLGNGISELGTDGTYLWLGTDAGVSRIALQAPLSGYSPDSGDWVTYTAADGLGGSNITAMSIGQGEVWVAAAHDSSVSQNEVGDGISVTRDGGQSWTTFRPERGFGLFNTVWGLSVTQGSIWAAAWNAIGKFESGLIRSRDGGQTWESFTPNTRPNGEFTFAVLANGSNVWVGTAGGVSRSTDDGMTWQVADITNGLTGNWVFSISLQETDAGDVLWAVSWPAGDGEKFGVIKSLDGGATWSAIENFMNIQAIDFSFSNNTIWVATFEGLWSSIDEGESWQKFDDQDGLAEGEIVSVHALGETVWAGSSQNGLSLTRDSGSLWQNVQASFPTVPIGASTKADTLETYAFPNPFSPINHGEVRIRYSLATMSEVTIEIYDVANRRVKTLLANQSLMAGEQFVSWDGNNGRNRRVANGVYLYRVSTRRGQSAYGKIIVLD